jgi:nuclear pore complex protein Nup160
MSGFPAARKRGDAMDADANDDDENASSLTRLEYYETLMLFFERLGGHAAAAECAHAALREVSAAFGSSDALDDDDAEPDPPNARDAETLVEKESASVIRRRRASRLWANLLQYALDLGKWRDAYAATLSVPGAESRRNALRRLVAAACDPNDARLGGGAALASAPLSGDRLDAVADALETRAAASASSFGFSPALGRGGSSSAGFSRTLREVLADVDDVTRANSPGRVLYALRVARGEMREAARAARAEASRLGRVADSAGAAARRACAAFSDVTVSTEGDMSASARLENDAVAATTALARVLEAHVGALLAAANALRLCAPGERGVWREAETDGVARMDESRDFAATREPETEISDPTAVKRRRRGEGSPVPSDEDDETVGAVARAAALAAARLELLVAGAEPAETLLGFDPSTETETETEKRTSLDENAIPPLVASLVSHARFASAEALACAWTEGEALTEHVCLIAATLAARAALAQQRRGRGGYSSPSDASDDAYARDDVGSGDEFGFVAVESLGALGRSCAAGSPFAPFFDADRACGGGILGASLGGERREEEADAAQAWTALRVFLERHDVAARNFRPAEAAARAVLATGTQIRLPQWLAARFVRGRNAPSSFSGERSPWSAKGMAARDANPAALLRVYLAHNRLEEAARLAIAEVAASRLAPATERARSCASWFPEPLLRHTRERVREVGALESLGEELERLLEQRNRTAEADSAKLAAMA